MCRVDCATRHPRFGTTRQHTLGHTCTVTTQPILIDRTSASCCLRRFVCSLVIRPVIRRSCLTVPSWHDLCGWPQHADVFIVLNGTDGVMDLPAKQAQQPYWLALPAGVLQRIFCLASTCQTPGTCLAASVCRTWRTVAAGCRGIRLLCIVGHPPADQSFAAWLGHNSQQLGSLVIQSSYTDHVLISTALAEAAAAAQAAGRPLSLHTLQFLHAYVKVTTAGRLVASLPKLRCLQVDMYVPLDMVSGSADAGEGAVLEALGPLQQATQLEELYLVGPMTAHPYTSAGMPELLPPGLKRLSWHPHRPFPSYNLSHLSGVTFLQLSGEAWQGITSSQLPLRLQQLAVTGTPGALGQDLVQEQRQVVHGLFVDGVEEAGMQQQLSSLPNIQALTIREIRVCSPAAQAALRRLSKLSDLSITYRGDQPQGLRAALTSAAHISSLQRLDLRVFWHPCPQQPETAALEALTALTQLQLGLLWEGGSAQQQRAWGAAVGQLHRLRWLSVPSVLLDVGLAWLGGLKQLRVLVVHRSGPPPNFNSPDVDEGTCMPWVEALTQDALPPQLQVLSFEASFWSEEATAETLQLRRRLRQLLSGSRCEVLVGPNLNLVAEPIQQLAGLPVELQRALT